MSTEVMSAMFKNPKMVQLYQMGGKFTKPYAEAMIAGLTIPKTGEPDLVIFDNACGTGVVSEVLYERGYGGKMKLTCGDFAEPMLNYVKQRIIDEGWVGATAKFIDAQDTKLPSSKYTHVFTNFAIFGMQDPDLGLKEIYRILKPNGVMGFTTWISPGWYPDTVAALSASPIPFPPLPPCTDVLRSLGDNGDWDSPTYIHTKLSQTHHFTNIKIDRMKNVTRFTDLDTFAKIMDVMFKQVLKKVWTVEQVERFGGEVAEALRLWLVKKWGLGRTVVMDLDGLVVTANKGDE